MSVDFVPGMEIRVIHPFIKAPYSYFENDGEGNWGEVTTMTWKPGTKAEMVSPDDAEEFADAEGYQVLTIISTHRPSIRYPERIFYTRKWIDPEGKEFGKTSLRIKSKQAFKRITKGYRIPYKLEAS